MHRPSILTLTSQVLRDPQAVVSAHDTPADLGWLAPRLLAISGVGAALFGAVVGSYRGGEQMIYAAMKLPILLWAPPLLALPAIHAAWRACDVDVSYRRLAIASLAGMARTGVLASALAPILWLPYSVQADYHFSVLLFAAMLTLAGLPGLAALASAIPAGGHRRWIAATGSLALVGLILAQTGWLLRPFVARPTTAVALFRPVEGDILTGLAATTASSLGLYGDWDAERHGLLSREARSSESE
ncbi:MAG: hypothetical protein Q8P18_29155 [Pseudomonadota bacterium]|nr:hypothetical protein [Pseudomonadota bacterium]